MDPLIIGVAGGSGSGKTTVVQQIISAIGEEKILLIQHDSYYRDLKHLSFEKRTQQNFDHPSSLETELMIRHIKALKEGYQVEIPIYDFTNHIRKEETRLAEPKQVILVDGILVFTEKELRDLMNIKLYVDTDDDIRLLRRIQRDIVERDRELEQVLSQYQKYVRPMHLEFVEPTKRYADIIIPHGGENKVALDMVNALIQDRLNNSEVAEQKNESVSE
ncbi:uridine kinase [Aliifodinibius salipaludis]|uniref:uridine kinase n=1 Tax=Fodinibius salipaludis TaxID=2032627 RepID=UPI0020D0DA53|nr:uridine kinase [Aliifodinibius salipaludis]